MSPCESRNVISSQSSSKRAIPARRSVKYFSRPTITSRRLSTAAGRPRRLPVTRAKSTPFVLAVFASYISSPIGGSICTAYPQLCCEWASLLKLNRKDKTRS
ncbi:hypothetical protein GQ53DRAFT_134898 [Thozetella sp. PMI_491]|nr:hypothetical protein GQ53DRAFT_134898 [Thozetella sp. PMI_491]